MFFAKLTVKTTNFKLERKKDLSESKNLLNFDERHSVVSVVLEVLTTFVKRSKDLTSFGSILPIFRGPFLERIARDEHHPLLQELADGYSFFPSYLQNAPLKDWYRFFYSILVRKYKCEYVYKNSVANQLYLKNHRPNKALLTDEFRIGVSRADVVVINSTSTVYEIKTKYDSLTRLEQQISDYQKVIDRIYVVTTNEKCHEVSTVINDSVGLVTMDDKGKLNTIKKAKPNRANTDPGMVFDCMRRTEYCSAIKEAFGYVPDVPNGIIYVEAKKLFMQLPPEQAHKLMVKNVVKRARHKPFADRISDVPSSLKHACLAYNRSKKVVCPIVDRLRKPLWSG